MPAQAIWKRYRVHSAKLALNARVASCKLKTFLKIQVPPASLKNNSRPTRFMKLTTQLFIQRLCFVEIQFFPTQQTAQFLVLASIIYVPEVKVSSTNFPLIIFVNNKQFSNFRIIGKKNVLFDF